MHSSCYRSLTTRNDMMGNKPQKVQNRAWTTTLGGYLAYNLLFITIVLYNVATIVAFYYFYSSRRFVSTVIACLPILFFGQLSQFFLVFSLFTGASARGEQYFDGNVWPKFARDFPIFVIMRKYLNLTIHNIPKELKEAEAQLDSQFIFALFPHGTGSDFRILMEGMLPNVFPNLYKRQAIRTLAASVLFRIPLVSHLAIWTGCIDANRKTAEQALRNKRSLIILPGGEAEQLITEHGCEKVYLLKRKGFIKLAMRRKILIVPGYVFGSSDLFHTSSRLYKVRHYLMKNFGVCLPLSWGLYGSLCPLPIDTTIVFGKPLNFFDCMEGSEPTDEELENAHQEFCKALLKLFNDNKSKLGYDDRSLVIL